MKRLASFPLILGFVGVAFFGFALFDMGPGHMGGCVASAIDGTACPTNVGDAAAHHLSAWQSFMTTVASPISGWLLLVASGLLLLSASFLLVSGSFFLFYRYSLYPKPIFARERLRDLALDSLYSQRGIISWLSLFELSPAR